MKAMQDPLPPGVKPVSPEIKMLCAHYEWLLAKADASASRAYWLGAASAMIAVAVGIPIARWLVGGAP